ncbi:TadE/TadG family type IV pilus assembly protein [Marinobacter sp. MDS2]|uniref:TadE/TadG family type IV pilus assembly protein n=1 Tax=Marinobacter sp. MDS2 TaxID=3065961 RepID=UPI00273BB3CF|nr:TadE/TadG family type IV pilus assembly protein [Marinobacter sp. MDS2]MDP4548534.1 pilus assembly protein [Marinobacter sp. MDS2]
MSNKNSGVVALEFIFILPLLIGLLYGSLVYALLFFHKQEMQNAVSQAAASVFNLDRRDYPSYKKGEAESYSATVVAHSNARLDMLVERLPARLQGRISDSDKVCQNVVENGVGLLECRLSADGTKAFLPQLKLGFLGSFPPQPEKLSVTAAVAF